MDFRAFTSEIEQNKWDVYGVEVYQSGKLLHTFGDTQKKHNIYSATKTVLSIAVGIASDRGVFDISAPLLEYLPRETVAKMSKSALTAYKAVTIRDLLTMSVSGLPFQVASENYLDYALSFAAAKKGEFNYSNNSAYLVGAALSGAIGGDAGKFIEEQIFAPLEITDFSYERSPEGYFYGASKMELSVHSLSKIALLLCAGGEVAGKRIVSAEYVKEATKVQQMNKEGGYGYFIWKYRDGFSINGKWGQKSYVLPREELVITHLAHIDDNLPLRECMEKYILGK